MLDALVLLQLLSALTFSEAKLKADQDEKTLSNQRMSLLTAAQAQAAAKAFAYCADKRTNKDISPFVVVMELDQKGNVARTWGKGRDNPLVDCMQYAFKQSMYIKPPHAPFYTSFEFSMKPAVIEASNHIIHLNSKNKISSNAIVE